MYYNLGTMPPMSQKQKNKRYVLASQIWQVRTVLKTVRVCEVGLRLLSTTKIQQHYLSFCHLNNLRRTSMTFWDLKLTRNNSCNINRNWKCYIILPFIKIILYNSFTTQRGAGTLLSVLIKHMPNLYSNFKF